MPNRTSGAPLVAVILVGCLVLGIGVSKAAGYWKTESSKDPAKIEEGEFAGMPDPGDIRGSYSFKNIEEAFGVPPSILAEAFAMPGNDPGTILAKEIEAAWESSAGESEVGTDAVRLFVALWTGLPHEPEPTTALPSSAMDSLLAAGKIDDGRAALLNVIDGEADIPAAGEPAGSRPAPTEEAADAESARNVSGRTTFGQLKEWGVTGEEWEGITGAPMGRDGETMRDWFEDAGSSLSSSKEKLQELIDNTR